MRHALTRRGFSGAFTLVELIITIALIGIIAALLMPNILQARQEALRQEVRQQAKSLEKALGAWFTAQPNLLAASQTWDIHATAGYINNIAFLSSPTMLQPYMPNGSSFISTGYVITTPEMQQVARPSGGSFIGGSIAGVNDSATTAHVLLFWDPSARTTVSPKVLMFLPDIP